jgi:hypothetical protein
VSNDIADREAINAPRPPWSGVWVVNFEESVTGKNQACV